MLQSRLRVSLRVLSLVSLLICLLAGVHGLAAQARVSQVDVDRLEEDLEVAMVALDGLPSPVRSRLGQELQGVGEDVIYLKVSIRKGATVSRDEFREVRDRLESIRDRIAAEGGSPSPAPSRRVDANEVPAAAEVAAGTQFEVRLQQSLSSETAEVEDRFEATIVAGAPSGARWLPAGSVVRGVVNSVDRAGRLDRTGRLTLVFDHVTVGGTGYAMRGTVVDALQSEGIRGETGKLSAGAAVGAVIGGLIGGVRGALTGVLVGAGGVIGATEGNDVELPAGTILRVRLDAPLILSN